MFLRSRWRRAAWLGGIAASSLWSCSLRGTDDLQSGGGAPPSTTTTTTTTSTTPTDLCDEPGFGECGGNCVDLTSSEDHCGVCDEPCGTGRCVQGSCLRVDDEFAGMSIEAGSDGHFFVAESYRCGRRLRTFDDDSDPVVLETAAVPAVAAVDAVTTRPDGRAYLTAVAGTAEDPGPLRVFVFDPDASPQTVVPLWTEDNPPDRDVTMPIDAPISYYDTTLAWSAASDLMFFRTEDNDPDSYPYLAGATATRLEGTAPSTLVWFDDAGLYYRKTGNTIVVATESIVDFDVDGTRVVWADGAGDIHFALDGELPGDATTLASGESVNRIALTVDSIYWTGAEAPGTLKRVPIAGGDVETLLTVEGFSFGALTTTGSRVYWTANGGADGCDGRVYRRRLAAPALP